LRAVPSFIVPLKRLIVQEKKRAIPSAPSPAYASLRLGRLPGLGGGRTPPFRSAEITNYLRELARTRDPIGAREFERRLRHTINDGAIPILNHRGPALFAERPQTLRTVATHAR
jgi:hypothetical protein